MSGQSIEVVVTADCAGPATMAVFVALFALMSLDLPLPPGKAVGLLLFGVVGTWLQSFLRLVYLLLTGYYFRQVGSPPGGGVSRMRPANDFGI